MKDDQTRAWDLMSAIDYCMLVTQAGDGLHARPMSSIVKPDEGKIYFLSDASSTKDEEIANNPDILLAYSNGSSKFVSAMASASASHDRALIDRLWNPGAQAFWPKGPSDPSVIAIIAVPTHAQFWDGSNAAVSTVRFAIALMTGTKPDPGETAKVVL